MSEPSMRDGSGRRYLGQLGKVRSWPLSRQLTVTMAALMVIAVVIIGSLSVGTQRQSLLNRLDDQLRVAFDISARSLSQAQSQGWSQPDSAQTTPPADAGNAPPSEVGPAPQLGSLSVAILDDEILVAQVVDEETGATADLTDAQIDQLLQEAGTAAQPTAVELADLGTYRVAAEEVGGPGQTSSDGQTATVVAGQSLSEVSRTVRDQILVFTLVAIVTISVTLLIALWLIRLGLRPLNRLVQLASGVSSTPLSSGTVQLSDRMPGTDAGSATEVGQVGEAFNTMLDHVETSLQSRQESEDRLRRFIADASHELRTPLSAIMGYAELAGRVTDQLPESAEHSLSRIRSESARMTVLVEDLLLLARLDSGASLREEPVALAGLLVDACTDAQVTSPDHRWVVELSDDAAEMTVQGDAGRLHQVMTNLLTNASTHTPPGTTVTLRLYRSEDTSHAVIEVEDDGPGIPAELQDHIFDRFVRGDDSRSRIAGGTGLGMSIVQAILAAHRGQIDLVSDVGETRFTVTLPLCPSTSSR